MLRPWVEPCEDRSRLRRYMGYLVVVSHESANGVEGVEPHDRDELDLITYTPTQELNPAEAGNPPVL